MIALHLPALQVVIPLVAAPLCALLRRGVWAWLFVTAVTWVTFAIALTLLAKVTAEGVLTYEMGGWAAPWGIEYRIDRLNALVLVIVAGIGALVAPSLYHSVQREVTPESQPLFYTAFLLALTGYLGVTITGDAFNLYVFLEIASLASYTLVALGRDRRALAAAFQYLVLGTIGATFILIGVGLLYMMTGTLNMVDLAARIAEVGPNRTVRAAFAFIVIGTGLKFAMFPLHAWLPNAYTYAPSVVSAFLAATATKVGVYMLLRLVFGLFGAEFAFTLMPLGEILIVFGLVAIVVGSLVAIFQRNLKRMLAYSSIAQIGYMALGIGLANLDGMIGGIVHLFNHAVMKATLFLALACVFYRTGAVDLETIRGLGRRMPWTIGAFTVAGFSLVGVPMTVGFVSKWYLLSAAVERGLWPIAVVIVGASLLALIYIWRVVEAAYFQPPREGASDVVEAPVAMVAPMIALAAACLYFGLDTGLTVDVARVAAAQLLGIGS